MLGTAFSEVLEAARVDAPWAFEKLFKEYSAPISDYLRGQGVEDHEVLASEVFVRAFTHLSRFSGTEGEFRSWLFSIAHNLVIDDRRRRSRRPNTVSGSTQDRTETSDPTAIGLVEDEANARLGEAQVRAKLERLAPDQRDVLLLRIIGDLTIDQIAEVLNKRRGAVKALQRRGLEALRKQLESGGVPL